MLEHGTWNMERMEHGVQFSFGINWKQHLNKSPKSTTVSIGVVIRHMVIVLYPSIHDHTFFSVSSSETMPNIILTVMLGWDWCVV